MEKKKTTSYFLIFDVQNTLYSERKGIFEDVIPVLKTLKENNIYLGIISNMFKEDLEYLLSLYGIKEYFDIVISSYEYDTLKPDPKLINIAIALLKDKYDIDIDKKNVFYVGDRPDVDMRLANLSKINGIRIIRGKYALKEPEDTLEREKYRIKTLYEILPLLGIRIKKADEKDKEVEII